ncbi:MAG: hypothetical protein DMG57_26745 [Acidobacteria bacterium]|nr:MAG: hypothetical protein DMG57_26745 [Acidobacteriota bacterium]
MWEGRSRDRSREASPYPDLNPAVRKSTSQPFQAAMGCGGFPRREATIHAGGPLARNFSTCGTKLMSAEVFIAKDSIDIGVSLALFDTPCPVNIQGFCYDKRFLVMEPSGPPSLIAVIQNWTAGLKQ